jgi:hypothetical protein
MSPSRSNSTLAFSILLESPHNDASVSKASCGLTARLLSVFAQHDIPATWSLRKPWEGNVARKILEHGSGHELALLGNPNWGHGGGNARIPMELSRRLRHACEAGLSISSVVLPAVDVAGLHAAAGLLASAQVRAVWSPRHEFSHRASRPVALFDRVWHIPGMLEIMPPQSWLAAARQRSQWRRTLQLAFASRGVTHVWADASTLHDAAGVASLEAAVRAAASVRSHTGLRIAPLGEIADSLEAKPRAPQAHSILRAA